MDILGQILKLTVISIFFSAGATIYLTDTDLYDGFFKYVNTKDKKEVEVKSLNTYEMTKEEIKQFRKYLRDTDLDSNDNDLTGSSDKKTIESESIWNNNYER